MITEQQRQERRLGVGGSDIPIIMGLSPYKTPYQLYLEKTEMAETKDEMTESQYWGYQLESVIRNEFSRRNNVTVETPDTLIHPFYSFLRGNVDGFIPELNSVLEIKCSSAFSNSQWGDETSDNIPKHYLLQVAHYCAVANADSSHIAVLIGGNDYREYKYERDMEVEQHVINAAEAFWECVQTRTPPKPTKQVDLRLMFPNHIEGKKIIVNTDLERLINNLVETRTKIKELTVLEEKHKFDIMQLMKDSEYVVDISGKPLISYKANKRGSRTFLLKGM